MKLSLGFSPCPNDTFIFDALVNGKIDTGGFVFDVVMEDVQTLNEWALQGKLDISKISYGVLPLLLPTYQPLRSGGALGRGVGPLLIGNKPVGHSPNSSMAEIVNATSIALPGKNTTAHYLFSSAFPGASNKLFMPFHQIEDWVLAGNGLGVIIHENRFTYAQKGLHCWADLGEKWEAKTGYPIPLGGIVMKRTVEPNIVLAIDQLIRNSVSYAFQHLPHISDYIFRHSQEMDPEVVRQHVELYVNDFSLDIGEEGEKAIEVLFKQVSE